MIRVGARVDDVANGLRGDAFDRVEHAGRGGRRPRVHDDQAVLAHLHADVRAVAPGASRASDHEERRAHLEDLQAVRGRGCALRDIGHSGLQRLATASIERDERHAGRRDGGCAGATPDWKCNRHDSLRQA